MDGGCPDVEPRGIGNMHNAEADLRHASFQELAKPEILNLVNICLIDPTLTEYKRSREQYPIDRYAFHPLR